MNISHNLSTHATERPHLTRDENKNEKGGNKGRRWRETEEVERKKKTENCNLQL